MSLKPLRIAHVVPSLGIGGAERLAYQLSAYHARSGNEVHICVMTETENSELDIKAQQVAKVHYADMLHVGHLKSSLRISGFLSEIKPHVVHTHIHALSACLPALGFWRVPVKVHTVHNLAESELSQDQSSKRFLIHKFMIKHVVPVSIASAVTDSLNALYGDRGYPQIMNGIEVARYKRHDVDRSALFGVPVPEGTVVFLAVGRLADQKNHVNLFDAFRQLRAEFPQTMLMVAGIGPNQKALEEKIAAEGLTGSVILLGLRDDVPELLSAADVFVLASNHEGSPLSVMEALSAGLPVISTAVGGVPELIDDGETGFLVGPKDTPALADAMKRIMNPATRQAIIKAVAASDIARFDMSEMARNYLELYHKLLTAK